MTRLPDTTRILLGPGPSMTSPRVMRAMASPTVSHLDPIMLALLDDVRGRLGRLFRAPDGSFAFAVSGTGTSGMETVVANLVGEGTRVLVVVTGYFGDRLAQMCERYGAKVTRLDVEWGRACDPDALRRALAATPADIVAIVHAETSTGVLNPGPGAGADRARARRARHRRRSHVVRRTPARRRRAGISTRATAARRSAWARPLDSRRSCSRPRALERRVKCRSFYFDLQLLQDYWINRKYHHTMSSTLVYALAEALAIVEEEGLEARWSRHERNHLLFGEGLQALGLSLLPPQSERLWTLNAVRVPAGIDEAGVRKQLLEDFGIEIGAGLGPLAGKIWRVGLMGASSSARLVALLLASFERTAVGGRRPTAQGV